MEDDKHQGVDNGGADCEFKLRSYQQEMLEESLKRNVIVAVRSCDVRACVAFVSQAIPDGYWER